MQLFVIGEVVCDDCGKVKRVRLRVRDSKGRVDSNPAGWLPTLWVADATAKACHPVGGKIRCPPCWAKSEPEQRVQPAL